MTKPINKEECCENCLDFNTNHSQICSNFNCPCHSKPTELRCECDDLIYLSNPPQNKCKHCGKFWFCKDPAPICGRSNSKPTELSGLLKAFDEEFCHFVDGILWCTNPRPDDLKSFLTKTYTTALAKGQAGERLSKKKIIGEILELRNKNPYHSPENRSIYDFAFEDILKLSSLSDISSGLGGGE